MPAVTEGSGCSELSSAYSAREAARRASSSGWPSTDAYRRTGVSPTTMSLADSRFQSSSVPVLMPMTPGRRAGRSCSSRVRRRAARPTASRRSRRSPGSARAFCASGMSAAGARGVARSRCPVGSTIVTPGTPCAREPGVRGAREDGVGGPEVARQAVGVVVRRADEHALEQLVLVSVPPTGTSSADSPRDGSPSSAMRSRRVKRYSGPCSPTRERHLVEHEERGDDLRDARDRGGHRRSMPATPAMPATETAALPVGGPGGRRGGGGDRLHLDGRRRRARRRAAATAESWRRRRRQRPR